MLIILVNRDWALIFFVNRGWALIFFVNREQYPLFMTLVHGSHANVNFAVSRQTVNRRLVARAHKARRLVKVPRLTVRAKLVRRHWVQKHINRPLGQWKHVVFSDEGRFMLFRIDNRIRVRRLVVETMH